MVAIVLTTAMVLYTLIGGIVYLTKGRQHEKLSKSVSVVQVSGDGKTWETLLDNDLREGWLFDPSLICADVHSPTCNIRKNKMCSCGANPRMYMN